MTHQEIINLINTYIKTNGQGDITGSRLNTVLNALADYFGVDSVEVTTLPAGSQATASVSDNVLSLGIPKGKEGEDAVNPFKGWWPDLATLKASVTAIAGDSAYVKDPSPATTWSIYVYDATATTDNYWADSGRDADTSDIQTFQSGEQVNQVSIVNDLETGGEHDVLSAEQGVEIQRIIFGLVESLYIQQTLTPVSGYINMNNKWVLTSGTSHVAIGVTGAKRIYIEGVADGGTYIAFLRSYPTPIVSSTDADYSDDTERIAISKTAIYQVPNDANYLYIMRSSSNGVDRLTNAKVFVSFNEDLDGIADRLEQIGDTLYNTIENIAQTSTNYHYINASLNWAHTANQKSDAVLLPVTGKAIYQINMTNDPEEEGSGFQYNYAWLKQMPDFSGAASDDFCSGTSLSGIKTERSITEAAPSDAMYLYIRTKISGNLCTFEVNQLCVLDILDDMSQDISRLKENEGGEILVGDKTKKRVYLGTFRQRAVVSDGIGTTENLTRVANGSTTVVPYVGCKLFFKLPENLGVFICAGAKADVLNVTGLTMMRDGDTYTFSSSDRFYHICFARPVDTNPLSVAEVEEYIALGVIDIYYYDESPDIVTCNIESEKYIKSIRRQFYKYDPSNPEQYPSTNPKNSDFLQLPLLLHTSDLHGDDIRTARFLDYADYLQVDAALLTGDLTAYTGSNYMDYTHDLINAHKTMGLICVGNHDAYELNSTTANLYANVMKRNIDKYNCVVNVNETYPTYYYKDIAAKQLRIISLNSYLGGYNHATTCYYTQEEINWFISVLQSTPANYGVIVMFHAPENPITRETGYEKFWQEQTAITLQYQFANFNNRTRLPIAKIVDAFVSGVQLVYSFDEVNGNNTTETITINADFTTLNAGVEFLFFACGHEHSDRIGYVRKTDAGAGMDIVNNLLVCNVTCGTATYSPTYRKLAEISDLPRQQVGSIQDSFNLYAVDREKHELRIARVGSNINNNMQIRDYMIIPYR